MLRRGLRAGSYTALLGETQLAQALNEVVVGEKTEMKSAIKLFPTDVQVPRLIGLRELLSTPRAKVAMEQPFLRFKPKRWKGRRGVL